METGNTSYSTWIREVESRGDHVRPWLSGRVLFDFGQNDYLRVRVTRVTYRRHHHDQERSTFLYAEIKCNRAYRSEELTFDTFHPFEYIERSYDDLHPYENLSKIQLIVANNQMTRSLFRILLKTPRQLAVASHYNCGRYKSIAISSLVRLVE